MRRLGTFGMHFSLDTNPIRPILTTVKGESMIGREGSILEGAFVLNVRIIGERIVYGKWVRAENVTLFLER